MALRLLGVVFTFLAVLFCAGMSHAMDRNVLVLHSYSISFDWTASQDRSIREVLARNDENIVVASEFLDTKRHPTETMFPHMESQLERKYAPNWPEVIIVTDNNALNFILPRRGRLFPGVPIVFSGINNYKPELIQGYANVTGIAESISYEETVYLIKRLFPDTEDIYLLTDMTVTGNLYLNAFKEATSSTVSDVRFQDLFGWDIRELETRLAQLPEQSVVIYFAMLLDSEGNWLGLNQVEHILENYSKRPVVCVNDFMVGRGTMGGIVTDSALQGTKAARMALRILNGESAGSIPVDVEKNNTPIFDYDGLVNHNVDMSMLPEGSVVINEPQSFYSKNKTLVRVVSVLLLFQTCIILYLIQVARERKRTSQALAKSEQRLDRAMNAANDGLWDWNLATNTVEYGRRWFNMLGYDLDDFPHNYDTFRSLVHPHDLPSVEALIQEALESGEPYVAEFRMKDSDGNWRWILSRAKLEGRADSKEWERLVGTHTEISKLKEVEFELRDAQSSMNSIIASMPSVMIAVDKAGGVTHWNQAAEELLGKDEASVLGCQLDEVLPQGFAFVMLTKDAAQSGDPQSMPRRLWHVQNRTMHVAAMAYPLLRAAGGAVLRIDDVTERVRMEEVMVQTEKMLSVGGLAAGMAHEINNPLGGILQGAQNILRRISGDLAINRQVAEEVGSDMETIRAYMQKRRIVDMVEGIRSSGDRAARIVSNMLSFSRRSESQIAPNDIHQLIDSTLELASSDYDLKKNYDFRKVKILRSFDPALPKIPCTATEIEQVLLNLLRNAAHAMAESVPDTPTIKLETKKAGSYAAVSLEDNGPGIPEDVRKRVFEPFFTTKGVGVGTGLGLSVSYFIITENHSGQFTVEPGKDGGTRFTFYLPLDLY